jgi:hypothetical protein
VGSAKAGKGPGGNRVSLVLGVWFGRGNIYIFGGGGGEEEGKRGGGRYTAAILRYIGPRDMVGAQMPALVWGRFVSEDNVGGVVGGSEGLPWSTGRRREVLIEKMTAEQNCQLPQSL